MNKFKKAIKGIVLAGTSIMGPALAMAETTTLTVPDVGTSDLYSIAGVALAFIAVVVALCAGIKLLKSSK